MEERSPAPQNSLELQPTGARRRISGVTAAQPAVETPAPETPPAGSSGEQGGQASLERRRARLAALQSCEFADLRIDRVKAAMLVLAVLPRLQRLRPQVEELLASSSWAALRNVRWFTPSDRAARMAPFEELASLAQATLDACSKRALSCGGASELATTFKRAKAMRNRIVVDVRVLQARNLLPAHACTALKPGTSYRNVAMDLLSLVGFVEQHWPEISGRCALTAEELMCATRLGQTLLREAGTRRRRTLEQAVASGWSARAFTALHHAYEDLRRCVAFLEPLDFEELTPSLYSGRGRPAARATRAAQPGADESVKRARV